MGPTSAEMLAEHIRRYYPSCVKPRRPRKREPKPVELPDPNQLQLDLGRQSTAGEKC